MNDAHERATDRSDPLVQGERLDLASIRARLERERGEGFWRSLDEIAETHEFQEFMRKEFPRQAAPLESSLDRRAFLKLLGASMALAGLAACARPPAPREQIVPYVRQPEEITPGKPLFFATAVVEGGYAEGVLAESHQGRPTRVEGNPDHPASLGAIAPTVSATVLSLYDPDRSQSVLERGSARTWEQYVAALREALEASSDGSGVRLLTETITSPTVGQQLRRLLEAYPNARWHQWDPLRSDAPLAGARSAYGEDLVPVYDLGAADVVLSLDADFTNRGPGRLRYARDFARRRRVRSAEDDMNRLWQVESTPSPTGSLADHRLPLAPADIAALAGYLATEFGVAGAPSTGLPERVPEAWAEALIDDLREHAGRSLVIAGLDQTPAVHALAYALNEALGNAGETVRFVASPEAAPTVQADDLADLSAAMQAGDVHTLMIIGANPAYTAPAALRFDEAMALVERSFHLGQGFDETAALATWHAPQAHVLETWGDARAFDGTVTLTQPLFSPFYGGRSELELFAALLGEARTNPYDVIRDAWRARVEGDFDAFWQRTLYRGVVDDSASSERSPTLQPLSGLELPPDAELVLHVVPDPSLADGRHANNGWLQELPRPFTKLTWDNAAILAPATAQALGVSKEDRLAITTTEGEVTLPVWVQPGQAPGVISAWLGYGRRAAGRVGNGVGVDLAPVRSLAGPVTRVSGATRARGRHRLATTQPHHNLDGTGERRHIVRAGTLAELRAEPDYPTFVHPVAHHESDIFPDWPYDSYQWGMVIDMTVCTGCNACVTACQSENNIPIVGKDQVLVGREMHWIRVDAYHHGGLDDPAFYHMPMACQHCEKAPCEPVCPVAATVHDSEGLNVMVYNRCVGTRYCANNCPYKVRRFNYLQYAELSTNASELSLANNPEVTVRSRGVMEKCTYCTQRINAARIQAGNEGRRIRDGEVVTACQSACPTEAIVFGDLADERSSVSQAKRSVLDFALLEELNTVPRTTYLARVSNPHPALDPNGGA